MIVFEALLFTRHAKIMSAEVKCAVIIIVGSVGQSGLLITCWYSRGWLTPSSCGNYCALHSGGLMRHCYNYPVLQLCCIVLYCTVHYTLEVWWDTAIITLCWCLAAHHQHKYCKIVNKSDNWYNAFPSNTSSENNRDILCLSE